MNMKLQAQSSRALTVALQKSAKCIASRPTIAVLENVLLTRNDAGQFFLTSSTSDSQLTISVPLTLCGGNFEAPVVLPIKTLMSLLSTLPDCAVTIDFADNKVLTVDYCTGTDDKVKAGKAKLVYFSGEDFPSFAPIDEKPTHIQLPLSYFHNIVNQADNFVEDNELRPTMSSLCIDIAEDRSEVVFAATDGHVLTRIVYSNDPHNGGSEFFKSGTPCKILLHRRYFRALSALDKGDVVDIESDSHRIRLTAGDTVLCCSQVEGRYPNYNAVIPRNNPYFVTFNKKEMLDILRRVSVFSSNASRMVELTKRGLFMEVKAQDEDFGLCATDQVFLASSECDDDFYIAFSIPHLQSCISALPTEVVRMQLLSKDRAAVLTPDEPAPSILTLNMPMQM